MNPNPKKEATKCDGICFNEACPNYYQEKSTLPDWENDFADIVLEWGLAKWKRPDLLAPPPDVRSKYEAVEAFIRNLLAQKEQEVRERENARICTIIAGLREPKNVWKLLTLKAIKSIKSNNPKKI